MRVGVLTTDGGSHPAEKWAAESAAQITDVIVIEPGSIVFDAANAAKIKFESDLVAALSVHHETVKSHEVAALDKNGAEQLVKPVAPEQDHLDEAVAAVQKVADASMFSAHFHKPEVQAFVRSTLVSHFSTIKHIERSWHADKNPGTDQAKIFRAQYHG